MGLPEGRKGFKIGLVVLIQYRRVTDIDRQTPSHPASHVAITPIQRSLSRMVEDQSCSFQRNLEYSNPREEGLFMWVSCSSDHKEVEPQHSHIS